VAAGFFCRVQLLVRRATQPPQAVDVFPHLVKQLEPALRLRNEARMEGADSGEMALEVQTQSALASGHM
jgi:hypothetical protein